MASEDGHDAHLWKAAVELGIAGLLVDAEYGGIGAGPIEIEIVMEEAGAALMPAPLLRSEEHTSELSHGYISYAVFCLKKKKMHVTDCTQTSSAKISSRLPLC